MVVAQIHGAGWIGNPVACRGPRVDAGIHAETDVRQWFDEATRAQGPRITDYLVGATLAAHMAGRFAEQRTAFALVDTIRRKQGQCEDVSGEWGTAHDLLTTWSGDAVLHGAFAVSAPARQFLAAARSEAAIDGESYIERYSGYEQDRPELRGQSADLLPTERLEQLFWESVRAPEGFSSGDAFYGILYALSKRPLVEWNGDFSECLLTLPMATSNPKHCYNVDRHRDARLMIMAGQSHPRTWDFAWMSLIRNCNGGGRFEILRRIDTEAFHCMAISLAATLGSSWLRDQLLGELQKLSVCNDAMVMFAETALLDDWQLWTRHFLVEGVRHDDEVNTHYGQAGELAEGETLEEVREVDAATLAFLDLTHAQLAAPLRLITDACLAHWDQRCLRDEWFTVTWNGVPYEVQFMAWMGHQECPWYDYRKECWQEGSIDITVRDPQGRLFTFGGLLPHYIEQHQFFEGSVPYRVEPLEVTLFFGAARKAMTHRRAVLLGVLLGNLADKMRHPSEAVRGYALDRMERYLRTYAAEFPYTLILDQAYADVAQTAYPADAEAIRRRYEYLRLQMLADPRQLTEEQCRECAVLGFRFGKGRFHREFSSTNDSPDGIFVDRPVAWARVCLQEAFGAVAQTPYVSQIDPAYLEARMNYFQEWEVIEILLAQGEIGPQYMSMQQERSAIWRKQKELEIVLSVQSSIR